MDNEIKIFLTPTDAELFKQWQHFYDVFNKLSNSGAFNVKNGSVEIHFDHEGTIKKIERRDSLFDSRIKSSIIN
jgi:hypothetical protein